MDNGENDSSPLAFVDIKMPFMDGIEFSKLAIDRYPFLFARRMEKAVEYAERKMLMYQAADKVGIPDPNYFGRCFKKHTGKSYSEYTK